jgi:uncharacterized phage-associated protein
MNDFKVCVQAMHFLLSLLGETDKLKIIKLMFLSDKCHLINFGRTITDDSFIAMKHGPVGSMSLDVLDKNMEFFEIDQIEYCNEYLEQVSQYVYRAKKIKKEYDLLSESDKEIIQEIVNKFGHMNSWDLIQLTHKYPEWAKFEQVLNNGIVKCENINISDMFSTIPNDPLGIPPDIIKDSKDVFLGVTHHGITA